MNLPCYLRFPKRKTLQSDNPNIYHYKSLSLNKGACKYEELPHAHSNQNRNAAIYSTHTNSGLQQKQIWLWDVLWSQTMSSGEALSIHSSSFSHVSATQESSVRAKSTTSLATRQSSFPGLAPLENYFPVSSYYLLKSGLSSTFTTTPQDFAWCT